MTSSEDEKTRTKRDAEDSFLNDDDTARNKRLPRLGLRSPLPRLGLLAADKRLPRMGRERRLPRLGRAEAVNKRPVSYTHLTLPTIYSV